MVPWYPQDKDTLGCHLATPVPMSVRTAPVQRGHSRWPSCPARLCCNTVVRAQRRVPLIPACPHRRRGRTWGHPPRDGGARVRLCERQAEPGPATAVRVCARQAEPATEACACDRKGRGMRQPRVCVCVCMAAGTARVGVPTCVCTTGRAGDHDACVYRQQAEPGPVTILCAHACASMTHKCGPRCVRV